MGGSPSKRLLHGRLLYGRLVVGMIRSNGLGFVKLSFPVHLPAIGTVGAKASCHEELGFLVGIEATELVSASVDLLLAAFPVRVYAGDPTLMNAVVFARH